jgi:hypothetical protein
MVPSAGDDRKDSADKASGGQLSYMPPAQTYYQSETQVMLDDFHAQFQEESGSKYNERDANKGEDSNDEEVFKDDLNKL